jgi:hypothetical protein
MLKGMLEMNGDTELWDMIFMTVLIFIAKYTSN